MSACFSPLRLLLLLCVSWTLCSVPAQSEVAPPEDRRVVRIVKLNWASAEASQEILAYLLRARLGFEVEWIDGNQIGLVSMATKNAADVLPEAWFPEQAQSWPRFIGPGSDRSLRVNREPLSAQDGIYVPQYVAREHGLSRIEDLTRPEVARLFDSDDDGLGEIWLGDPSWVSTMVQRVKAKSYGYAELYENQERSDSEFRSTIWQAFQDRRPLAFYSWEPSEMSNRLNMVRLEEPEFDGFRGEIWKDDPAYDPEGCFYFTTIVDPDWLKNSEINCAAPTSKVWIVHRTGFHERYPDAGRFLDQTVFTTEMIQAWLRLMFDYQITAEDLAPLWVAENFELVGEWFEGVESAMLAPQ